MAQPIAQELYQLIIEHVNDATALNSLALCCSAFRHEAQRCLFRYVEAKSLHRQTQFPAAINASPLRLGLLVYALELASVGDFIMMDRAWMADLSLALRAMHNLKHLAIDRVNPSTVLKDCTFVLETLYCGRLSDKSHMLFLFCNFLPAQPSIKRLQITHSPPFDVAAVPANLCPNLDFLGLAADLLDSSLLCDTRLITRFEWQSWLFPELTIPQLNHLEYLFFSIVYSDMDASFTLNLTSLVHLELYIELRSPEVLSQKLQFLRNIPLLGALVLQINRSYLHKPVDRYHLHSAFTPVCQHAFKLRPTLKYIDVGGSDYPFYHRFFRPENGENDLVSNGLVHEREVRAWRLFV